MKDETTQLSVTDDRITKTQSLIDVLTINSISKALVLFFIICFFVPFMIIGGFVYASIMMPEQSPMAYDTIRVFFSMNGPVEVQKILMGYWRSSVFASLFVFVLIHILLRIRLKAYRVANNL
ncbi:hypothetical protein [Dickeya sp. NCPPB 3274]|uniref:hypothetical protein n=1 Tax=Dickeya sp. NCPPB 3274 TaxID=568766 RepID=UPI0005B3D63D|nr:hypothetical protein [Dickeya sp. NCPPB 3274]